MRGEANILFVLNKKRAAPLIEEFGREIAFLLTYVGGGPLSGQVRGYSARRRLDTWRNSVVRNASCVRLNVVADDFVQDEKDWDDIASFANELDVRTVYLLRHMNVGRRVGAPRPHSRLRVEQLIMHLRRTTRGESGSSYTRLSFCMLSQRISFGGARLP